MRSLRPFAIAALACLALILAACGSSAPTATSTTVRGPGNPGIGASLSKVQRFFESQGGGQWQAANVTGGVIGYAVYKGPAAACPVSLQGLATNINNITVFCDFGGAIQSTPEQATAIMAATVDRFAPGASTWVRQQLQAYLANPVTKSVSTKKVAGNNAVTLTRAPGESGEILMMIQPEQLTLAPPAGAFPPTTTHTT